MRRNSLCHDKKLTTPGSSSWMLSTIARSTLILQVECAKNLGIGVSTPARWEPQFRDNDGDIPVNRKDKNLLPAPALDLTVFYIFPGLYLM